MTRWVDDPVWSDEVSQRLFRLIPDAIPDKAAMKELWEKAGLKEADLSWDGTPRAVWASMLKDAHNASKLPELLEAVGLRVPRLKGHIDAAFLARAPVSWYSCKDRFATRLFGPGFSRVLIDRVGLSQNLRDVVEQDYPVCSIRGEAGSGKSHSRHLIHHVARHAAVGAEVIRIDIASEWPTSGVGVREFAAALAVRLRMESSFADDVEEVDRNTTFERVANELARAFLARFADLPRRARWVLIDGLDRPVVEPSVHPFVGRLAKAVVDDELPLMRLFVTGYEGEFHDEVIESLREEQIAPIERDDVRRFFEDVWQHQGVQLEPEEAEKLTATALQRSSLADLRDLGRVVGGLASERFREP